MECRVFTLFSLFNITEPVVAESVVAIRRLLQQRPQDAVVMITQLTKALDEITEPLARANIFWLVGQFCSQLPLVAPDVLRKAAKSFCSEVKKQTHTHTHTHSSKEYLPADPNTYGFHSLKTIE